MKINGQPPSKDNIKFVVIPRNDCDIVFKAKPINYAKFDELMPRPEPQIIEYADGTKKRDVEDPSFNLALANYANCRTSYLFVESLSATEGLEWGTVDINDPKTYPNWLGEMRDAGFSEKEIDLVMECVTQANAIDEEHLKAARERFLAMQREQRGT